MDLGNGDNQDLRDHHDDRDERDNRDYNDTHSFRNHALANIFTPHKVICDCEVLPFDSALSMFLRCSATAVVHELRPTQ